MKLKWKEDAVSPVIATILMVAITVVLAAVLYVMVIGMSGGGSLVPTPVGSWQAMDPTSNHSGKMVFGSFSPEVHAFDMKILVEGNSGQQFNFTWSDLTFSDSNYTLNCDGAGITAFYYDTHPEGGLINAGDYIEVFGLEPFTVYTVRVFHYPSDSICQMAGDTSFQTLL